jgi:hypothetical protein
MYLIIKNFNTMVLLKLRNIYLNRLFFTSLLYLLFTIEVNQRYDKL